MVCSKAVLESVRAKDIRAIREENLLAEYLDVVCVWVSESVLHLHGPAKPKPKELRFADN